MPFITNVQYTLERPSFLYSMQSRNPFFKFENSVWRNVIPIAYGFHQVRSSYSSYIIDISTILHTVFMIFVDLRSNRGGGDNVKTVETFSYK